MARDPIERALGVWSGTNYRSVMLPGLGAVTCGELCDAIAAERALAERVKPFKAAAEEAYWLLAWTWQSHLTGPGKPFDMSIFAPEARDMMTKAEQDLFDALSEIEP